MAATLLGPMTPSSVNGGDVPRTFRACCTAMLVMLSAGVVSMVAPAGVVAAPVAGLLCWAVAPAVLPPPANADRAALMAALVAGPAVPSTTRPFFDWNARMQAIVRGPSLPSSVKGGLQ